MSTGPLFADDLEAAFVGLATQFNRVLAVYDLGMVRAILADRGMNEEQVQEYVSFNILGAWVGPSTPVFLEKMDLEQAREVCAMLAD